VGGVGVGGGGGGGGGVGSHTPGPFFLFTETWNDLGNPEPFGQFLLKRGSGGKKKKTPGKQGGHLGMKVDEDERKRGNPLILLYGSLFFIWLRGGLEKKGDSVSKKIIYKGPKGLGHSSCREIGPHVPLSGK